MILKTCQAKWKNWDIMGYYKNLKYFKNTF